MNNVTLVLVILYTEEMEIYCNSKYLHGSVIMILLEKTCILRQSIAVNLFQRSPALSRYCIAGGWESFSNSSQLTHMEKNPKHTLKVLST